MTPAMFLAAGGALGAVVRMFADKNVRTLSRETFVQAFIGAVSMGIIGSVPAESIGQWVPGVSQLAGIITQWFPALLAGALGGYSGLDLMGLLARRFGLTWPQQSTGGAEGPGAAKLGLVLLAVALAAAGCGTISKTLGYQSETIPVPRDPVLIAYGEARMLYKLGDYLLTAKCATPATTELDRFVCTAAGEAKTRAQGWDRLLQDALVDNRRKLTAQDVAGLVGAAGELFSLAGLAVPQLGAAGKAIGILGNLGSLGGALAPVPK